MNKELSTRDHIISTADLLFYQNGYDHTSFADISSVVNISRGNFYHHFKTKDEILEAVIELRLTRTKEMLNQWEKEGKNPTERIQSFIHMMIMNKAKIKMYGCPVGTLCTELAKLDHASKEDSNKLFTLFHEWLEKQFLQLGHKNKSKELAMHLLARSQGIAVLANAFCDEKFIQSEAKQLGTWLESLKN